MISRILSKHHWFTHYRQMVALALLSTLFPFAMAAAPAATPAMNASDTTSGVSTDAEMTKAVNDVPPTPTGLAIYVTDQAGLLNSADHARLQRNLQALDEAGVAQIAVLILPETDRDLSEFGPVIMNQWDIQHTRKKDGLLVLVNAGRLRRGQSGNRIFVATGTALQDVLPDALVGRVLDAKAVPAFAQGRYSEGVTEATLTLARILNTKRGSDGKSARSSGEPISWPMIFLVVFLLLLLFGRRQRSRFFGSGGWWGGYYGGGGGFSGGGGFGGGFGGGGDSSDGGGSGR